MKQYPELTRLRSLQKEYALRVRTIDTPSITKPFMVELSLKDQSWRLYVEDEYGDFNMANQLACLYLVLKSLEEYESAEDYLYWCTEHGLNASDMRWLDYFLGMEWLLREVKEAIGSVAPGISDWDYQMRSGAYAALMQSA